MATDDVPDAAEAAEVSASPEPSTAEVTSEEKTWAMLAHLLSLVGYVIPFGNIIAPLVIWMVKKDSSKFVDYHGKESLNFQINILVYILISIPLIFCAVGIFTMIGAAVYGLVMAIIAGLNANSGQWYKYPYTFRLIT